MSRALLELSLHGVLWQRLVESRVHESAPVVVRSVGLPLLAPEDLAADDPAAFGQPVYLVRRLPCARRRKLDDRSKALPHGIEHVLAERARRLERSLPGTPDDPASRKKRVPLSCGLFQEDYDQGAHPPRIGRIIDPARLGKGKLLANSLVRKQPSIHGPEGNRLDRSSVPFEEQIGVGEELGIGRLDSCIGTRCRIVDAECLVLGDRAATQQLQQRASLSREPLPALPQAPGEQLRDGAIELRGILHHGIGNRPRIGAVLALAQQLDLVGEQAPVLEPPLVAESRERRAEARKRSPRLPEPVELGIDPGERLVPRAFNPPSDPMQRRSTGHQGSDGAVVRQEFRAVGVSTEVLVRGEGDKLPRIGPFFLRQL